MWLESLVRDPLTRLIAQIIAVIVVSRLLGIVAKRLNQPMVIAEITAGILLGPSLLGLFWPEVGKALFAPDSLKALSLLSQVGLVLFMFLIGLELDFGMLKGRGRASVAISHSSIVVPFALGAGLALYMYPRWSDPSVPFSSFVLFLGAAMSITAFPVLARILSERQLLGTRIGAVTIACAAVDDVTAWCLLAFIVAAAKAEGFWSAIITTGLAGAYVVVMFWVVRPLLRRVAAQVNGREGLTQNVVASIILLLLLSSWTTELIGIHALFGAFLFGAILPKEGGLAHALAEKLEDLVLIVLLPLFFAYSGVRTQIGLLNSAEAWLTCALVVFVACLGKFGGSFVAARLTGLPWRESAALGVLMNTRGLMELIVLNLGLDLGILSPTLFTMMVVMALVTTVMTSPLLERIYPRELLARELEAPGVSIAPTTPRASQEPLSVLMCVANDRSGPALLNLANVLRAGGAGRLHALHLVPATDRASFYVENTARGTSNLGLDAVLDHALEQGLAVTPASFVSTEPGPDICRFAELKGVDLALIGWHRPVLSQTLLGGTVGKVLDEAECGVGVFVDRGFERAERVLVPLVGTFHERAVLSLVRRLARSGVAVTLLHVKRMGDDAGSSASRLDLDSIVAEAPERVTVRVVQDASPIDAALTEGAEGYDLVIVGMGREWGLESGILGRNSQRLMRNAPASMLIVRGRRDSEGASGASAQG
jgi:Kef-type K+ transport system membrane component KefB/nucleotide-binding universal stress UspA family protein